jgi:hypothetical protein
VDIDGAVNMASTLLVTGVLTGTSLDISGDIDVDGITNLDVVDIDGAVNMASTLLVTGGTTLQSNLTVTGTITIGSAVVTEAQLEILDGATVTTAELNIMDGGTSATSTTVAAADRVVYNDEGTMKQVAVTDISTYMNGNAFSAPSAITTTSTLTPSAAKSIYQRVTTAGGAITLTVATGSLAIGQYVIIDKTAGSAGLTLSWAARLNRNNIRKFNGVSNRYLQRFSFFFC